MATSVLLPAPRDDTESIVVPGEDEGLMNRKRRVQSTEIDLFVSDYCMALYDN
jgi:hypothetical protein